MDHISSDEHGLILAQEAVGGRSSVRVLDLLLDTLIVVLEFLIKPNRGCLIVDTCSRLIVHTSISRSIMLLLRALLISVLGEENIRNSRAAMSCAPTSPW